MDLFQAAVEAAEAAAVASEESKTAFVDGGIGPLFVAALDGVTPTPEVIRAMSRVVRRLTTADDDRPVVSRSVSKRGRPISLSVARAWIPRVAQCQGVPEQPRPVEERLASGLLEGSQQAGSASPRAGSCMLLCH